MIDLVNEQNERTALMIGAAGVEKLAASGVIIFGLGGVGGQLTEALARAGIGRFLLVDFDQIAASNINRQAFALHSTVGQLKTDAAKSRILDINPAAQIATLSLKIDGQNIDQIDFAPYDFVADAVDSLDAKIAIIKRAKAKNKAIISSMGAGNRLFANFLVADIAQTHGCPLAKKMRQMLKKEGIEDVKVVFSPILSEQTNSPHSEKDDQYGKNDEQYGEKSSQCSEKDDQCGKSEGERSGRRPIGSISFIPPAAGLAMAGEIIRSIIFRDSRA